MLGAADAPACVAQCRSTMRPFAAPLAGLGYGDWRIATGVDGPTWTYLDTPVYEVIEPGQLPPGYKIIEP